VEDLPHEFYSRVRYVIQETTSDVELWRITDIIRRLCLKLHFFFRYFEEFVFLSICYISNYHIIYNILAFAVEASQ